jgi:hypothetical protein
LKDDATVQEIVKIPIASISKFESEHLATKWLLKQYGEKENLYGYCLADVKKESKPFRFPKNRSIWFTCCYDQYACLKNWATDACIKLLFRQTGNRKLLAKV